jgi:hypothetical protein
MKDSRINKIINHASKLIKELVKEWFGEEEKEKPDDKGGDTRDH